MSSLKKLDGIRPRVKALLEKSKQFGDELQRSFQNCDPAIPLKERVKLSQRVKEGKDG